jgi:SAM-dependent methyltransferase
VKTRDHHEANRAGWNQGAARYEEQLDEDIGFLRAGGQSFCAPELPHLALDGCGRAIHLQCAGGRDTLSLWNRGAKEVVGVDISDRMIDVARRKSEALGAPATWIRADVLDAPAELDGTADLVYTGRGALSWLHDLDAWAAVVDRLLAPGGTLHLFEGHPISWVWDTGASEHRLDAKYGDYFQTEPQSDAGWPSTYIGDLGMNPGEHATKWERQWTVGAVVTAVARTGLAVSFLGEYPDTFWQQFPAMPPATIAKLPNTFLLRAAKL